MFFLENTAWKVSNYVFMLFLITAVFIWLSLHEKCPNTEFLWSVFSRIGPSTEYLSVSPRIQSECGKIWTRKSSVFGHFSCSAGHIKTTVTRDLFLVKIVVPHEWLPMHFLKFFSPKVFEETSPKIQNQVWWRCQSTTR